MDGISKCSRKQTKANVMQTISGFGENNKQLRDRFKKHKTSDFIWTGGVQELLPVSEPNFRKFKYNL